jgi:hypothetical protein
MAVVTNINRIVRELQDEFEEIDAAAKQMVKQAASYIIYEVQDMPPDGTPRDTRRAVNGWNISPGSVGDFTDPGEAFLHGEPDPEMEIRKLTGDETEATIANGVHYIGLLEFGSSAQAPSNFVRMAIDRAVSYLDFAKLTGKVGRGRRLR